MQVIAFRKHYTDRKNIEKLAVASFQLTTEILCYYSTLYMADSLYTCTYVTLFHYFF